MRDPLERSVLGCSNTDVVRNARGPPSALQRAHSASVTVAARPRSCSLNIYLKRLPYALYVIVSTPRTLMVVWNIADTLIEVQIENKDDG